MFDKRKSSDFAKNWNEYKEGFGSIQQNSYWMGLEKIHQLTKSGDYGLEVTLKRDGTIKTINYDSFKISGEEDKFRLSLSGFKPGTSGLPDHLQYHNAKQFTTRDQDNDEHGANCAQSYGKSGWWYISGCYWVHLQQADGSGPVYSGRYDESTMILKR